MSSKLNSGVRYAYMRGGAAWESLRVKADMMLFAGNTVWSISEPVRGVREDAIYKSALPLPLPSVTTRIHLTQSIAQGCAHVGTSVL